MRFTLYANGEPVGWAEMTGFDPSMGGASGAFHPNQRYHEIQPAIRQVFLCNGTLGPRDDLKLDDAWREIEALNLQVR